MRDLQDPQLPARIDELKEKYNLGTVLLTLYSYMILCVQSYRGFR